MIAHNSSLFSPQKTIIENITGKLQDVTVTLDNK